ncbi:MAG TPA: hypothetical protein VGQ93_01015 [Lysobacter sp.]|jgi:hypothetical protein|nr:hypothetical protein [Lysobacter sp.]
MFRNHATAIALAIAVVITGNAIAASREGGIAKTQQISAMPASPAERGELIRQFVLKWGVYVENTYGVDARTWSSRLVSQFATGDATNLRRSLQRETYEGAMAVLDGAGHRVSDDKVITALAMQPTGSDVMPMSLGGAEADLVYTPIQPCRIVDTRSTVAGAIAGNSTRSFIVWGAPNYTPQGGSATDCGLSAESPAAAVLNVTAVLPTGGGYATVYPYNTTRPGTASVNYAAGNIVNNSIISKLASGAPASDITIYTSAKAHYVVDVVGYFDAPHATALDCTDVTDTQDVAAGARVAGSPSCPAGYTLTGGGARTVSNDDMILNASAPNSVGSNDWFTSVQNTGLTTRAVTFTSRCCRVPGR